MRYGQIKNLDKPVSRLLFGTTEIREYDETTEALLDGVRGLGITSFDTARVYTDGRAEGVLGKWMEAKKCRDELVLLSKCGHPDFATGRQRVTRKDMLEDLETALEQLRTDKIDIYLLHRDDPTVPVGEIAETFQEMYEQGKVSVIGGSNWHVKRIEEYNAYAAEHGLVPFTVSSPNFGLAEQLTDIWGWGCVTIAGPAEEAQRRWYIEHEMPVFAYSSLARGMFSGKFKSSEPERMKEYMDEPTIEAYGGADNLKRLARCEELAEKYGCTVAQIAMSWLLHQQVDTYAIVSTSKAARMQSNIEALEIPLSAQELAWLDLR